MLNRYPMWKYLLILFVLGIAVIYAAPNLYPPDPAVQISAADSREEITDRTLQRATYALKQKGIEFFGEEVKDGKSALIRLKQADDQLRAKATIQATLKDEYIVALNLAPTTPEWLINMGAGPMTLGLDLSGGVHFLMEVDMEDYMGKKMDEYAKDMKGKMREERIRYRRVNSIQGGKLEMTFRDEAEKEKGESFLRKNYFQEFIREDRETDTNMILTLAPAKVKEFEDFAISQNLTTLRNRVNELGVAEPLVQRQGRNRIVIELPGVQDTAEAKKILGKTATLEFRLEALPDATRSQIEEFEWRDRAGTDKLERKVIIGGDSVTNAQPSYDENGMPQVNISLDSVGGAKMAEATKGNVGRRLGVLFVEQKFKTTYKTVDGEQVIDKVTKTTEKKIISLATIQAVLGSAFRTTGLDVATASELALLLRAGALAAPMFFVEERTIGPSLGKENIELGVTSVQFGMLAVVIFMILWYRLFGIFATLALTANLVIMVAVMSMLKATLTLPGIAGIVLTVGMAVDANVLIFARIREELKNGLSAQQAIHEGYARAFITILDANFTTLIVAIILFAVGTGPVQGFAVTLSIGILTSMFTSIMFTRALANMVYGGRKVEKLSI